MTEQDMFNIITFSSSVNHWSLQEQTPGQPLQATEENKAKAIEYIVGLDAGGGTNINEAILQGLKLTELALETEQLPREVSSMLVFLTDGLPSSGVTNNVEIRKNVKDANKDLEVSIFCIGFGRDADFDLMKQISQQSNSFAKRIYEGSDAALQLEGFYSEISSPLISNLNFKYVGGLVDNSTLSDTKLKTFFKGGEFVTTGKLLKPTDDDEENMLTVHISGDGKLGKIDRHIHICLRPVTPVFRPFENKFLSDKPLSIRPIEPPVFYNCTLPEPVYPPRSKDQSFMQSLHAFINIKQLLKKDDDKSKEKALDLALENNFVTDLTSLVVVQPDNSEPKLAVAETEQKNSPQRFGSIGSGIASQNSAVSFFSAQSQANHAYSLRSHVQRKKFSPQNFLGFGGGSSATRHRVSKTTYRPRTTTYRPTTSVTAQEELQRSSHKESIHATVQPATPECSGNITLFSKTYHRGENITLVNYETTDLGSMDNKTVSVEVGGDCCWHLFDTPQLSGVSVVVNPAEEYISVTSLGQLFRKVSSVRKISCN